MTRTAEVVICGAGICGVAAAYFLSRQGVKDILLIDERPPLSLTSDRSTECYRNWWPDPPMLALMNRSIVDGTACRRKQQHLSHEPARLSVCHRP
jgi:glycine/D-amino acid oxidase-like deaminating enzyme